MPPTTAADRAERDRGRRRWWEHRSAAYRAPGCGDRGGRAHGHPLAEATPLRLEASLSTDRYVAILDRALPNTEDGPHAVQVVDLDAGRLLDLELLLGGRREREGLVSG